MAVKKRRPKKGEKKSKVSVATPRSRAGLGFDFEDQVGAYLLLRMLTGQALLGADDAIGSRLQTQTAQLGWSLDDLLVSSDPDTDRERRVAISCKSNTQVSASGLPKDFVLDAWEQWCRRGKTRINRGRDFLLLATRGYHARFERLWADVKLWSGDVSLGIARITATARHRAVFASVKGPIKKKKPKVTDNEVLAFIQHLVVLSTDFQLAQSRDRDQAISNCRSLLRQGTLTEGRKLWNELIDCVRGARLGHGTIELGTVNSKLSEEFELNDHPSYASSWLSLDANTQSYTANIETALPNGFIVNRAAEGAAVAELISKNSVAVIYGESGVGKSAAAKAALDEQFCDRRQVWFGPDQLPLALSETERVRLGLTHPLAAIPNASSKPHNILVIDAAERLSRDVHKAVHDLIRIITTGDDGASSGKWRVVIVGQTEAWTDGGLSRIAGIPQPPGMEIEDVAPDDVKGALRSAPRLSWAASHDEIVGALRNLRTLAWVLAAETRFPAGDATALTSYASIADHLWLYWTEGRLQGLLMRFAEREAAFEHSFEVSRLDPADAATLEKRPNQTPLRRNARNRIEFQHDLAAEWARFQRLKEIADKPDQWALYAERPLWVGALRMLGGYLLRETINGQPAWDVVFEKLDAEKQTLAADIMLDALCLDPLAETFLTERCDLLFTNHGRLLDRLLRRFQHVATRPGGGRNALAAALSTDPSFSLLIETQFRSPIIARWPPMARFLDAHRERVAALASPIVANLCDKWLSNVPVTLQSGEAVILRREFGALALATARQMQLEELIVLQNSC